ncbi:phage tail tape measure protein [Solwaraspora sp. WMMD1047]|uniref:phage tail tape measure protein n=1 Tax=Solwaraspora sp. WMMD1047 TaxID=3016102 RepID=UPI00241804BF|nr:phage tail tape measure protein [Solwaraspora sp. WMMD1047]MDG4832434.1 phage tail tape measure protein [Solwaraspora sp. WMMD1047]
MLKLGELSAVLSANLEPFQRDLRTAKKAWRDHGDSLKASAAVAGAAIGAALGAGLLSAMELEKAQAKLTAQLGGDPAYGAEMGRIAGEIYSRGFGESAAAVGESLRGVLTAGLVQEDATNAEIESVTIKAQALADVFGQDVTATARAAGQMVRNGLAKNSAEAFDILTRGFQETGDHAGDLLDTYSEYSVQFRKLGLDGATATGLMTQGLKAGARDVDTVADAIKEFSIRAIDGSTASAEGFKLLGLNAGRMTAQIAKGGPAAQKGLDTVLDRLRAIEDPVKRDAAAVALFGTKAEDLGAALYALDVDTAADRLGNVTGAADRLGETLEESASQKLEAFKRQAMSALSTTMADAIPYLEKVIGFLSEYSEIVGPLAVGLGALALVIGTVAAAMKVWAVVQAVLNLALWTSPITWIVLGILILVGAIILIATKTTWFQDLWAWAWGGIKGAAMAVWEWIKNNWPLLLAIITGPIGLAVLAIVKNWDRIKAATTAVKDWIVNKMLALGNFVRSMPGRISAAASGMFNGIKNAFRSAINWIIGKWNSLSFSLPSVNIPGLGQLGGGTLSTPNIPYLAKGGDVLRDGLAVIHRGERVVPAAQVRDLPGGGHAEAIQLAGEFRISGEDLVLLVRKKVQTRGRGDVQAYFGGRS